MFQDMGVVWGWGWVGGYTKIGCKQITGNVFFIWDTQ